MKIVGGQVVQSDTATAQPFVVVVIDRGVSSRDMQ